MEDFEVEEDEGNLDEAKNDHIGRPAYKDWLLLAY
jgi:hypothetical protein